MRLKLPTTTTPTTKTNSNSSGSTATQHHNNNYHYYSRTKTSSSSSSSADYYCHPSTCPSSSSHCCDTAIFLLSLFLRELLSNFCILVLNSRLGRDNFLAGPIVTLYVILVFRRPLNNPFILTMACLSAGDWGKANVSGLPGFKKEKTSPMSIFLFWLWMLTAQLLGAVAAAKFRTANDAIFGSEFVNGAAWGSGQLFLRANLSKAESCWNKEEASSLTIGNQTSVIIPTRLAKAQEDLVLDSCMSYIQWRWWFMEDMAAVLFFIVGYVHVWRWLRWQDMKESTANEQSDRYWRNLVAFASASASLGLMNSMAFPTAHCGLHTSVFLSVYQSLNEEKAVTANFMNEPLIRVMGGVVGCLLAVLYERAITLVDEVEEEGGEEEEANNNSSSSYSCLAVLVHKILYTSDIHKK